MRVGQLRGLQVLVGLQVVGLLAMTALGGMMMEQVGGARDLHGPLGESLPVLALVQAIVAVLARRAGGPAWPLWGTVVLLVALLGIVGAGHAGSMSLHVPLGAASLGVAAVLLGGLVTRPLASTTGTT